MTSNAATTREGRAVAAVLDEVYAAWAAGDADAFVAPYGEHATAVLPGSYLRDRSAIRATMAEVFAGPLKGSMGVHQVQSIRFPAAEMAIVISKGGIQFAGQASPAPETRSVDTWLLSRPDGSWRVEAFHNCPEAGG
jgi:uncharacterized protein (TIGR02246 family)